MPKTISQLHPLTGSLSGSDLLYISETDNGKYTSSKATVDDVARYTFAGNTPPSSPTDPGKEGQAAVDDSYVYQYLNGVWRRWPAASEW